MGSLPGKIPPLIARSLRMVQRGYDKTGPNAGYERRLLQARLRVLEIGFAEIRVKAPYLVPDSVLLEEKLIGEALGS